LATLPKPAATAAETQTGTTATTNTPQGISEEQKLKSTDASIRVLAEADKLDKTIVLGKNSPFSQTHPKGPWKINENCWTASHYVYEAVEVGDSCYYSDSKGTEYSNIQIKDSNNKDTGQKTKIQIGVTKNSGGTLIYSAADSPSTQCTLNTAGTVSSQQKLDYLKPGDLISYVWSSDFAHNAIFVGWKDKSTYTAQLFDWNGAWTKEGDANSNGDVCTSSNFYGSYKWCKSYRYYTEVISDTGGHPVFMYWAPYILGTSPSTTLVPSGVTEVLTKEGDNTIASTTSQTITTGDKIGQASAKLIMGGSTDVAAKFVSLSLVNAGVQGIEVAGTVSSTVPSTIDYLYSLIIKDSDFSEVNINNLKLGDIVLIGQGCKEPYSIGIFDTVSGNNVYVYANLGTKAQIEKISPVSSGVVTGNYIYKAYRYTGDLSSSDKIGIGPSRETWTLDSAITRVSAVSGNYDANKIFADQLIFDGILTEKDCNDVRGTSSIVGSLGGAVLQKDMSWLKKLLLSKKASSGTSSTTTNSQSGTTGAIPSTQYNTYKPTFEKYASSNQPKAGSTPLTSNDFKALLAAIAQQNNWGASTHGGSDWLMGYQTGNVNYQGVDKQISTVSSILKSVLEGDISNPSSEYRNCISTTVLSDRLHCILSVLKTGKTDSPGIVGIGANTEGDNYADSVLTLWNSWKSYFNSQGATTGSPLLK
jgi:plastocyanin